MSNEEATNGKAEDDGEEAKGGTGVVAEGETIETGKQAT